MTRTFVVFALALPALATLGQQPTFRTETEMVRIDTLVERNGTPVPGLTSADFTVLDNGIPQRIVTIRQMDTIAVGVALDSSGSMKGERFDRARTATLALLGELKPGEPSVVVGFADQATRLIPAGTAASDRERLLNTTATDGATSLADGAYAAVIACDTGPGAKLLVLLTDGRNNESWLSARALIDTARRHEVVIYPVGVGVSDRGLAMAAVDGAAPLPGYSLPTGNGRSRSVFATVNAVGGDALKLLEIIADQTGGRAIKADWTDDLTATFRAILEEYRQRYIIAFSPEAVHKGDGWHTLDVKLRRGVKGNVHARAGYWSK